MTTRRYRHEGENRTAHDIVDRSETRPTLAIQGRPAVPIGEVFPGPVVYRLYDRQERLVYVGMTTWPVAARLRAHQRLPWWNTIAYLAIDVCANLREAVEAELRAIREENPLENRAGRLLMPDRQPYALMPSDWLALEQAWAEGAAIRDESNRLMMGASEEEWPELRRHFGFDDDAS